MFASNRYPLVFVCVDMCAGCNSVFFRDNSSKLCASECTCTSKVVGRKLFYNSFLSYSARKNSFFSLEYYFSSLKTRIIIIRKYDTCPSVALENYSYILYLLRVKELSFTNLIT